MDDAAVISQLQTIVMMLYVVIGVQCAMFGCIAALLWLPVSDEEKTHR